MAKTKPDQGATATQDQAPMTSMERDANTVAEVADQIADDDRQQAQDTATAAAPPTAPTPELPKPHGPSKLHLALLAHGTLSGRERTANLERLQRTYGEDAVHESIHAFIENGLYDAGQVLTPKGQATRDRWALSE